MRALNSSELLKIWEVGLDRQPVERGLMILAASCPEESIEELARLSIGERDSRLLTLREWTFGQDMACLANCPKCDEQLEMSIKVADIKTESKNDSFESLSLSLGSYQIRFHLPDSLDLASIDDSRDISEGKETLFQRCIEEASLAGSIVASDQLPPEVISSVVEMMGRSDPQADIFFEVSCPECDCQWQAILDVLSFFWREISAWARRTLREVHALASAYGWTEADILAISPRRRQIYLEMVEE